MTGVGSWICLYCRGTVCCSVNHSSLGCLCHCGQEGAGSTMGAGVGGVAAGGEDKVGAVWDT
jgi:hypothetical protein